MIKVMPYDLRTVIFCLGSPQQLSGATGTHQALELCSHLWKVNPKIIFCT